MVRLTDINKLQKKAGVTPTTTKYNARTAQANATVQESNNSYSSNLAKAQEPYIVDNANRLGDVDTKIKSLEDRQAVDETALTPDELSELNNLYAQRKTLQTRYDAYGRIIQGNGPDAVDVNNAKDYLNAKDSVSTNNLAGYKSTYNAVTGKTELTGDGELEKSAIKNLRDAGMTDEQIIQRLQEQQPKIKASMSNTGQNSVFNAKTGLLDPRASAVAQRKASREAELAAAKGYVKRVDENGNESYSEDPAATAKMQEDIKNRHAQEDAAGAEAQAAGTENMNNNKETNGSIGPEAPPIPSPTASTDNIFGAMDPEAAAQFQALLGQDNLTYMNSLLVGVDPTTPEGSAQLDAVTTLGLSIAQSGFKSAEKMTTAWDEYNKSEQARLDKAAKDAFESQKRDIERNRKESETQYQRAIRDQERYNLETQEQYLNGLGISGAWKSSRATSDLLRVLSKNEEVLTDLKVDAANMPEFYQSKMLDIENQYHNTVMADSAAYKGTQLGLAEQIYKAAQDQASTVYQTIKDKRDAEDKAQEKVMERLWEATKDYEARAYDARKFLQTEDRLARGETRQELNNAMDDAYKHLSAYGDTNPDAWDVLQDRIVAAGGQRMAAGTTLEQVKAQKEAGAPGGGWMSLIVGGVEYSEIGRSVTARQPGGDKMAAVKEDLQSYLDRGDSPGFLRAARTYGFEAFPQAQTMFMNAEEGNSLVKNADDALSFLKTDSNFLKAFGNKKLSQLFLTSGDLPWVDAFARATAAQAKYRNSIAGVAVTPAEEAFMANQIVSDGDTVEKALTKLNALGDFFQNKSDIASSMALGLGGDVTVKGGGVVRISGKAAQASNLPVPTKEDYDKRRKAAEGGGGGDEYSFHSSAPGYAPDFEKWKKTYGLQTQSFDTAVDYMKGRHTHGGYDLAGKKNQAIQPLMGGKVAAIGKDKGDGTGWGNYVVLEDIEGNMHMYAHLNSVPEWISSARQTGATLSENDVIGYMGNTGKTKGKTGIHLHYEVKKADGTLLDPAKIYKSNYIAQK